MAYSVFVGKRSRTRAAQLFCHDDFLDRCRMRSRSLLLIVFLPCFLASAAVAAPPEETPAPDAKFFEVMKTDDVYGLDLMEDLRHAVFAHQDANLVTVWDITTLEKVASFESPAPRAVLCRGTSVYIGSGEAGVLTVYDGAKKWQKTNEVKLPLTNVYTLSAPGGKAFRGQLLALCDIDARTRQPLLIDTKTKKAAPVHPAGDTGGASVDYEGKYWILQVGSGSPSRCVGVTKSWPLLVAGRDSPSLPVRYETLQIIKQVQPGPYWIGGFNICKGVPPTPVRKEGFSQFVIPDRSKQLVYQFSNPTFLEARELTGTIESIGTRNIYIPQEYGRYKEMNPHVVCFYDFMSFAVTGQDGKLRIFSYDGSQKLVWTVTVEGFPGEDARIQAEPLVMASNGPDDKSKTVAVTSKTTPSATPAPTSVAKVRTWTDQTGAFKVTATFVQVIGDKVQIKRTDGRMNLVPIAQLSAEDQAYLKEIQSAIPKVLPKVESEVAVTVEAMYLAYAADKAAANAKFKDKLVEVSGVVQEPRHRQAGDAVSVLVTWPTGNGDYVHCRLQPSAHANSLGLWPGQTIKLVGNCLGNPLGKPMLDDCQITEIGPPPKVTRIAAADLIDAYRNEPEVANAKYAGKALLIEGHVAKIEKSDQVLSIGKLGDSTFVITAVWRADQKDNIEAVEKLNVGAPITLRAICKERPDSALPIALEFWSVE
jgi:hypothetical protein